MASAYKMNVGAPVVTMPKLPYKNAIPSEQDDPNAPRSSRFPVDDPANPPMETRGEAHQLGGDPRLDPGNPSSPNWGGGVTGGKGGSPISRIGITDPGQGAQKGAFPMPAAPTGATGGMIGGGAKPDMQSLLTGMVAKANSLPGGTGRAGGGIWGIPLGGGKMTSPESRGVVLDGGGMGQPGLGSAGIMSKATYDAWKASPEGKAAYEAYNKRPGHLEPGQSLDAARPPGGGTWAQWEQGGGTDQQAVEWQKQNPGGDSMKYAGGTPGPNNPENPGGGPRNGMIVNGDQLIDPAMFTGGGKGAASGAPTGAPAGGGTGMPTIAGGDIAQQVRDYFQSRGVTPNESTPQYWAEKWNEFGAKDPEYFNRRLSQADEFGGGGGALTAGGGSFGGGLSASDQAAGGGPLFQSILSLLRRGEKNVDVRDPNIAIPTAAFKAQTDHAARQARSKMAERAAQQGLLSGGAGSGAFDSGIRSMLEQGGRDVASYEGGLLTDEIGARRGDVRDALGLGNQSQQFYDSLAANIAQGNNSANLQQYLALLAGLGG
jgi:hypothetical protein